MSKPRIVLALLASLMGIAASGLVLAYLLAAGDPQVPATVEHDPSLPAMTIDGIRLHAEVHGDPADPVVIVLHGGPGDDYLSLLPLLPLAQDYRLVFYDQRGAGLSQRVPADQLTPATYTDELHGVINETAGNRPVHLIGHSWGAMLAAHYIAAHPDRVQSAVLAEPGFLTANASREFVQGMQGQGVSIGLLRHAAWTAMRSLHLDPVDDDARLDWLLLTLAAEAPPDVNPLGPYFCNGDPATGRLEHWRFGSTASIAAQSAMQDGTVDFGLEADLAAYPGRVLLLTSSCNALIGEAFQREHHLALFSDVQITVVEGAGHSMFGEKPKQSLAIVRKFLAAP